MDAIHDFSYEFHDNGLYLLTGVSGSGKSTLLNILSATDIEYRGRLYYNDIPIGKQNAFSYRSHISSICFQDLNLIPSLTVEENLKIAFELAGKEYTTEKAREILKKVNLPDKKEELNSFLLRNVNELSGGQRQRIALARCLAKDTKILFCDEPTASLDENNALSLVLALTDISKEILVIVATHSPSLFNQSNPIRLSIEDGIIHGSEVKEEKDDVSQASFGKPRQLKPESMFAIAKSFFRRSKLRLIINLILTAISLTAFSAMTSALMMDENKVLLNRQLQDGNPLCVIRQFKTSDDSRKQKITSLEEHMEILKEIEVHQIFSLSELMGFSQKFMDASTNGPFTKLINRNYFDNGAIELWSSGNENFLSRDTRLRENRNCHIPQNEKEIALSSFYAEALMKADGGGLSISGEPTPGPFLGFKDINQLIGQDFHGFTITDIYSTKEDKRVMPLLQDGTHSDANFRSSATFLYVCNGFSEKNKTNRPADEDPFPYDYAFPAVGKAKKRIDDLTFRYGNRIYEPVVMNRFEDSTIFITDYIQGVPQTHYLFLSLVILFLFISLLSLLLFFLGNINRESYVLGILNSMGISKKGIFLTVFTESTIVSVLSLFCSLISILITFSIIDLCLDAMVLTINPMVFFSLLGMVLLLDFLITLFTYSKASRTNPRKQLQDIYS